MDFTEGGDDGRAGDGQIHHPHKQGEALLDDVIVTTVRAGRNKPIHDCVRFRL